MAIVIPFIPAILEGLGTALVWGWRAYRIYRAAQTIESVLTASQEADDAAKAKEKEKTAAQTKADAAASADCKNCNEEPECETWRNNIKKALYEAKKPKGLGGTGGGGKGLAQRLCEWVYGTVAGGAAHDTSVDQELTRIDKNLKKLRNSKNRCTGVDELEKEAQEYTQHMSKMERANLPHLPRADFQKFCYDQAVAMAEKVFGV